MKLKYVITFTVYTPFTRRELIVTKGSITKMKEKVHIRLSLFCGTTSNGLIITSYRKLLICDF